MWQLLLVKATGEVPEVHKGEYQFYFCLFMFFLLLTSILELF